MQKSTETKIDKLLDALKISQLDFANSLKVSSGAITNWKKRDLGINVINKIVNAYPQVSYSWLITGEGEILEEERNNKKTNKYILEQKEITRRINELISESDLSPRMFSAEADIEIDDFCKKMEGSISWTINDVNKICSTFRVRKGWLVDGEGQKFKAPDEILDTIPVVPKEDYNSGVGDILELYAQRLRLVDDLRTSLKEELEQVRIIKEELVAERDFIKGLKKTLHDAIFALRSAVQQDNYRPLIAADGNNI